MISGGLEKIAELGWIKKEAFTWWDVDYKKDPREFLEFEEFEKRLNLVSYSPLSSRGHYSRDLFVYTGDNVPITTLDIKVENQPVTLFITARPYTPKELFWVDLDQEGLITKLKKDLAEVGCWADLMENKFMFLPHVRGFVKERKGHRLIYYPALRPEIRRGEETIDDYENRIRQMHTLIKKELKNLGKEYLLLEDWYSRAGCDDIFIQDRVNQAKTELYERKAAWTGKIKGGYLRKRDGCLRCKEVEWEGLTWVVYDELQLKGKDQVAYYPIRVQGMTETIPAVISNRTHPEGQLGFFVLGIFYGYTGKDDKKPPRLIAFPFTNQQFAAEAAEQISQELNSEFRSVILNRRKGRNFYSVL